MSGAQQDNLPWYDLVATKAECPELPYKHKVFVLFRGRVV